MNDESKNFDNLPFEEKVSVILGPIFKKHLFILEKKEVIDNQGGIGLFFQSQTVKLLVYHSPREGEINCMLGSLTAISKFSATVNKALGDACSWHFLRSFDRSLKALTIEQLLTQVSLQPCSSQDKLQEISQLLERDWDDILTTLNSFKTPFQGEQKTEFNLIKSTLDRNLKFLEKQGFNSKPLEINNSKLLGERILYTLSAKSGLEIRIYFSVEKLLPSEKFVVFISSGADRSVLLNDYFTQIKNPSWERFTSNISQASTVERHLVEFVGVFESICYRELEDVLSGKSWPFAT